MTKLGRLVKDGLEEIYLYSLSIKEHEIIYITASLSAVLRT